MITQNIPSPPKKKSAVQDLTKNLPSKGKSKCRDPKVAKHLATFRGQPGRTVPLRGDVG